MASYAEHVSIRWGSHELRHFLSRKYFWKCRIENVGHWVSVSMCWIVQIVVTTNEVIVVQKLTCDCLRQSNQKRTYVTLSSSFYHILCCGFCIDRLYSMRFLNLQNISSSGKARITDSVKQILRKIPEKQVGKFCTAIRPVTEKYKLIFHKPYQGPFNNMDQLISRHGLVNTPIIKRGIKWLDLLTSRYIWVISSNICWECDH